ncbi:hypothetical protein HK102_004348 [Quaeritorhiza haematococci]|nr:hypothetical protein HK102_004348 [Quaeritorhiza haematococci]
MILGKITGSAVRNSDGDLVVTLKNHAGWTTVTTWSLEDGGVTMVRHVDFDSPTLKKKFKLVFEKKA